MNYRHIIILPALCLGASAISVLSGCGHAAKESPDEDHLVILHTNDTHSTIEPDRHNLGGIARRKVLVDSVRGEHRNVLLVDAGDAVQGSLYYTLFGGEVERKMMNALGYDYQILGNHEFDKGIDQLAKEWSQLNAVRLSTNYDFTGTPLEPLFVPSALRRVGDHTVGFIGINLDPEGIVIEDNYKGVRYQDAIERANAEAARLREAGATTVVAITHIGYENGNDYSDLALAKASKDIDVIIGGHSHTRIDPQAGEPAWRVANAEGDTITVLQTGSQGQELGEVDIDLATGKVKARLIPVDSRLDSRVSSEFEQMIAPYKHTVDSVRGIVVGTSPRLFERKSPEMVNLLSDFVRERGSEIAGKKADLAIMNKGGIRNSLDAGDVTRGELIDIAPFDNSIVVLDILGQDLIDNIEIMAAQGGNGVSGNVRVLYDPETHKVNSATIDGKPIDPKRRYRLATIDYLAAGNDYMEPLKKGNEIARSPNVLYLELIDRFASGKMDHLTAKPDTTERMAAF